LHLRRRQLLPALSITLEALLLVVEMMKLAAKARFTDNASPFRYGSGFDPGWVLICMVHRFAETFGNSDDWNESATDTYC
jgi:hypothetical protein